MRTKTSYFNRKIFLQNLTHALPFIGIFALIILYIPLTQMQNAVSHSEYSAVTDSVMHSTLLDTVCLSAIQALLVCYSFLCAVWSFRYLFVQRLCRTMHALPLSRNALFITNALSGILVLLLPLLTGGIIFCIYLLIHGFSVGCVFAWFLITSGYCLFFFGLTVFTIMLSGHLMSIPVVYFILNFGILILEVLLLAYIDLFFYGFSYQLVNDIGHISFAPFLNLARNLNYNWETNALSAKGVQLVAIHAAVGILLCTASLFLYRRRALEKQGEPIVFKKVQPFIHYFCTVLGGSIFAILFGSIFIQANAGCYITGGDKLILCFLFLLGSAIFYYLLKMLLCKTLHVFRLGNKGLGLYLIISTIALFCVTIDLLGLETYQPEASEIASVDINFDNHSFQTDNREEIKQFLKLHRQLIEQKETITASADSIDYHSLQLVYTTKEGATLTRLYYIPGPECAPHPSILTILEDLFEILDNKTFLFQQLSIKSSDIMDMNLAGGPANEANTSDSEPVYVNLDSAHYTPLLNAMKHDMTDGSMKLYLWVHSQMQSGIPETEILYTISILRQPSGSDSSFMEFAVTKDCVHTLEYLKENGLDKADKAKDAP